MAGDLFRRNRPFHQLDGFYTEWSEHLTKRCLPLFRQSHPSAANNAAVLRDLISYYDTIDHYANKVTIFPFLFPSSRINSVETSILFLGDIYPHLFTTLVQSFREQAHAAWKDQSFGMKILMDQIKEEINVTVFRLLHDMKATQERFLKSFSDSWVSLFHWRQNVMETAASVTLDEDFVRIFREANQLRKKTITDIVNISDVNQAALFLEALCVFLAGFRSHQVAHVPAQILPNQQFPPNYLLGYQQMMQQLLQQQLLQQQQPYAPIRAQLPRPNYNVPAMTQQQPGLLHDIYVENLDPDVTLDMLRHSFRGYPSVREVKIQNVTGRDQKHGYVSFADESERRRAMQEMNGAMLLNKPMKISAAAHGNI